MCYSDLIFQAAKAEWSQTLWVDLNIQLLQEGVEGFIKSLKKLPKDARALPVAFFLEGHLKEFRESLPLLLDLKNEALRDRFKLQTRGIEKKRACSLLMKKKPSPTPTPTPTPTPRPRPPHAYTHAHTHADAHAHDNMFIYPLTS